MEKKYRFARVCRALIAGMALWLALAGASCGQKKANHSDDHNSSVVNAADKDAKYNISSRSQTSSVQSSAASSAAPKPVNLPGIDLSGLDAQKKARLSQLLDRLPSPCGKAHSLKTSYLKDKSCAAGKHGVRYVVAFLRDDVEDEDIRKFYKLRYEIKTPRVKHQTAQAPTLGPKDAPVHIVEYYDYGCPACALFAVALQATLQEEPYKSKVKVSYKQFPLPSHTDSPGAAQAALAAYQQDKFKPMHMMLFENQSAHKLSDLDGYAKKIGLDMTRYKADFKAAKGQVKTDIAEGERAGVSGTPAVFLNGRSYEGPIHPTYLALWLDEEIEKAEGPAQAPDSKEASPTPVDKKKSE